MCVEIEYAHGWLIDLAQYILSIICIYSGQLHSLPFLCVDHEPLTRMLSLMRTLASILVRVHLGSSVCTLYSHWHRVTVVISVVLTMKVRPWTHIFGIKGPTQLRVMTSQDISVVPDKIREWHGRWGQEVNFQIFYLCTGQTLDINSHETKKILELQRRYRLLFAQQVVPKES